MSVPTTTVPPVIVSVAEPNVTLKPSAVTCDDIAAVIVPTAVLTAVVDAVADMANVAVPSTNTVARIELDTARFAPETAVLTGAAVTVPDAINNEAPKSRSVPATVMALLTDAFTTPTAVLTAVTDMVTLLDSVLAA